MREAALSLVEGLERPDPPWWVVSSLFAASVLVAARVFYSLGQAAGRKETLNWLANNPAAGYQMREQRRNQRRRDADPPLEG